MLRIAITGGPGAGKTEISSYLMQRLEERGYKVLWVPETATELILNGIFPSHTISLDLFEKLLIEKQLQKEALYEKAVSVMNPKKTIIFYDRGLLDTCAYISKEQFISFLKPFGLSYSDALNRYDAVLHLVTAANGAEAFYQWNDPEKDSVGNNAARKESPAEAREIDKRTMESWLEHPHLRVFDNSTDFKGKVDRVLKEVFSLLGEPIPKEIERKYLVYRPTEEELDAFGVTSKVDIIQTYLNSKDFRTERRVRQRGTKENGFTFFYTEKRDLESVYSTVDSKILRWEREEKISQHQYLNYLLEADTCLHQIIKKRICFVYMNQFFELDLYPFDTTYALLEIETNSTDEIINLPPFARKFMLDVTLDHNYRNSHLAKEQNLRSALSHKE